VTAARHATRRAVGRTGTALCLSGGGFRAALFHLGAVRRLNELGILPQITTVSAVSGGSMLAAFLADRLHPWPTAPIPTATWDAHITGPFHAFVTTNLGTLPVVLGWLLPWSNTALELVASRCWERLTSMRLSDLPEHPRFVLGATNLMTGASRTFERTSPEPWSLARAVALSSCVPSFFPAYHRATPDRMALADGGVADEGALAPVWRTHVRLLVSDAADTLTPAWGRSLLWSATRSGIVAWNQLHDVRTEWLRANLESGKMRGAYWRIDEEATDQRGVRAGYSLALARDVLARVRTAYDVFSEAEIASLENHGYFLADAATHGMPGRVAGAPLKAPHPAWLSEPRINAALKHSTSLVPPRF
jgi:NTE family protein